MYTEFQNISDKARIWIYQSDRALSEEEIRVIDENMKRFIEKWTAHGNELYASAQVQYDHFLILALDEDVNMASGCSIDASVHFIKELEKHLNVGFFNRTNIAVLRDEHVELIPMTQMGEKVLSGSVVENDVIFNNLIPNKKDLENNWKVNAGGSWLKKYFKTKNTTV